MPTNITIHEDIGSSAAVLADSIQVHQVIMNLRTNAYHAMSETGGTLAVALHESRPGDICELPGSVSIHNRYLQLLISDTGHGIDKENLRRIFDPYFTTKDVGKGTGLGLAVVEGIVKNHDGFINCRSVPARGLNLKYSGLSSPGRRTGRRLSSSLSKCPKGMSELCWSMTKPTSWSHCMNF